MRLTLALLKWGKIPGKINQGKHQLPHYISQATRERFVKNLKIELENEMWLTRPCLTKEEEANLPNGTRFSAAEVRWKEVEGKQPEDEVYEFRNLKYRINMPPHVTLEERWAPLHTEARWEDYKKDDLPVNKFETYNEMAKIKTYPERFPRPKEKWNEWSKVRGIKSNPLKKEE